MAFDPTIPAQVNRLINDTVALSNSLLNVIEQIDDYVSLIDSNGVVGVLDQPGLTFPPPITTTPTMIQDARYALTIIRDQVNSMLAAGARTSLDRLRLSMGVLTGTN